MYMKGSCQITSGKPWKRSDDSQDQSLGTGHAKLRLHATRRSIQAVIDGPHEPHEIEHRPERAVAGSFRAGF
jgi:hypothetical protein